MAAEDVASLGLSVDSSQVTKGAKALDKLSTSGTKAQVTATKLNSATDAAQKSVRGVSSASNQATTSLDRSAAAMRRTASAASVANDNIRSMGGSFSGLAAQGQDIAVTAFMGMSPMMIALQQGTQIAGQMEMALSKGGSAVKVLTQAFSSLVSPISLVSIGATALVAMGIQYVMSAWSDESEEAAKSMDILSDSMDRVKSLGVDISEIDLSDMLSSARIGNRVEVELQRLETLFAVAQQNIMSSFGESGSLLGGSTFLDDIRSAVDDAYNVLDRSGNESRTGLADGIAYAAQQFDAGKISADRFESGVLANVNALKQLGVSIPVNVSEELLRMTEEATRLSSAIDQIKNRQVELSNGVKVGADIMESAMDAGAAAILRLRTEANRAETQAADLAAELTLLERVWRAKFILDVGMTGDIKTVFGLLSSLGAPTDLLKAQNDEFFKTQELASQYGAYGEGRTSTVMNSAQDTVSTNKAKELAAAMKAAESASKSAGNAAEKALAKAAKAAELLKNKTLQAQNALGQGLGGALKGLLDGTTSLKDALFGVLQNVLTYMNQINVAGGGSGIFGGGLIQGIAGGLLGIGFANGGYTGNGATSSVAGVVHGGEYVFSAKATKALGVNNLEAAHRAAKGYSSGGAVTPMRANDNGKTEVIIQNNIDATGADPAAIARLNEKLEQMESSLPGQVKSIVTKNSTRGTYR